MPGILKTMPAKYDISKEQLERLIAADVGVPQTCVEVEVYQTRRMPDEPPETQTIVISATVYSSPAEAAKAREA